MRLHRRPLRSIALLLCSSLLLREILAFLPAQHRLYRPTILRAESSETLSPAIIYQKVVKPAVPQDVTFLGSLIEYLQYQFELPPDLPMVYEPKIIESSASTEDRILLEWDSLLSPDARATKMSVEVIGIFTDQDRSALPDMAMIVVQKNLPKNFKSLLPPILENLFADSECRILKALDRALDDFASGKFVPQSPLPQSDAQAEMVSEFLEHQEIDFADPTISETPQQFVDAQIEEEEPRKSDAEPNLENSSVDKESVEGTLSSKATKEASHKDRVTAALETMNSPAEKVSASIPELDFAVRAAQKAMERRQTEDFAVRAARDIAAKRTAKPKESSTAVPVKDVEDEPPESSSLELNSVKPNFPVEDIEDESPEPTPLELNSIRPPILDSKVPRKFRQTFSTPEAYAQRRRDKMEPKTSPPQEAKETAAGTNMTPVDPSQQEREEEIFSNHEKTGSDEKNQDFDEEIAKTTQEILDEVQEEELSPEELLRRVMTFGDEQEKEETVGDGFVTGAFQKAKDLLRDERERTENAEGFNKNDDPRNVDVGFKELSEEEELRRMFEAGERIADGRITSVSGGTGEGSIRALGTTDADIDSVIAEDKTVSSYGRVLDDELAELELRINKSPDEATDGPRQNPIFDIFSGPEVYNPNVSPETVNWPGAAKGTKVVRLPKELDEAVRQASFAAEVVLKVKHAEVDGTVPSNFTIGGQVISSQQIEYLQKLVNEAVQIGIIDDPLERLAESSRLQMVIDELWNQPEERFQEIASNFRDLLLSDHFVPMIKDRLSSMADRDLDALRRDDDSLEGQHAREREILGQLVVYAQLLLKEARALGAELEAQQLEVVRSICKVAMDPAHQTEEDAAIALTDAVRDMRPLFDDAFVAYLKYAVAEEESRLARAGLLDDPDHSRWLYVLKVVQQGVYTELSRGLSRYIDHIGYVLRMETPQERRELLSNIIDVLPTLDVRPFVQVVDSIVGSLGDGRRGEFDGVDMLGGMTNKLLQLNSDMKDLLPPERIALMSKDADDWATKQRERLQEQRQVTKQRLTAARQTEHLDDEIEALSSRSEVERIE